MAECQRTLFANDAFAGEREEVRGESGLRREILDENYTYVFLYKSMRMCVDKAILKKIFQK